MAIFLWGVVLAVYVVIRYESLIKRTERECKAEIEANDKDWIKMVKLLEQEAIDAENECRLLKAEIDELKR